MIKKLSVVFVILMFLVGCGSRPAGQVGSATETALSAPTEPAASAPNQPAEATPLTPDEKLAEPLDKAAVAAATGKKTVSAPSPTAPQPLPKGELLADLGKDFRPQNNQPADTEGSGHWTYQGSQIANPWENSPGLKPMEWVGTKGAERFTSSEQTSGGISDVSLMADPAGKGVVITPSYVAFHYGVARWTSGVGGEVVIQGNFRWNKPTDSRQLEALVFVDGVLAYHTMLAQGEMASRDFRITANILPGATIDFLVGEGVRREAQARDSNNTTVSAAIVKTGDGKQEVNPDIVEKITTTWRKSPKRPFPKAADMSKSADLPENRMAWWRKIYVDSFLREYKKDDESKAQIVEFLDAYCAGRARLDNLKPKAEMIALGQRAMPRGNWDPCASTVLAYFLLGKGGNEATLEAIDRALTAQREFAQTHYPPEITALSKMFCGQLFLEQRTHSDPVQAQHDARAYIRAAVDDMVAAASRPDLTNLDRQMLLRMIGDTFTFGGNEVMQTCRFQAVGKLSHTPGVDPWIREMALANERRRLAWIARGDGTIDTVSRRSYEQFQEQMTRARMHALAAWKLHPDLPDAAAVLISITMAAGGLVGENERFWFDEALAADLYCHDAYANYAWALRPRWGGSHQQMLDLGREYLATGRFDTELPENFSYIVIDVGQELGRAALAFKMPGVLDDYKKLLAGYAAAAPTPELHSRYISRLAAVNYLAGNKEECGRLLEELGPQVKGWAFSMYGVSLSNVTRDLRAMKQKEETYFAGDQGKHSLLAFDPGTGKLLAAEPTGEISVWEPATHKQERVLAEHSAPLIALESVAGRKLILSASSDGKVVIWKSDSLEPVHKLELKRPIHSAAWNSNGLFVVVACGEEVTNELVTWDLKEDKQSSETVAVLGAVNALAVAEGGKTIYFSIPSGDVQRYEKQLFSWSSETGVRLRNPDALSVAVTSWKLGSGDHFFAGGITRSSNQVTTIIGSIAEATGAERNHIYGLPSRVTGILPLADGHRIAAVCSLGSVVIWDETTGLLEAAIRTNAEGLRSLVTPADESCLAAVDAKGYIRLWPLEEKNLGFKITSPLLHTNLGNQIRTIAFLDGDKLFVESAYGGISLWDWKTGCQSADHYYLDLNTARYNPQQSKPFRDGRRVAATTLINGQVGVQIHDIRAGKTERSMNWQGGQPTCIAVSQAGNTVAVGDEQGLVTLIDAEKGEAYPWGKLKGHKGPILSMEFTADGSVLATCSRGGEAKLWDLPSKPDAATKSPISRLTFSLGVNPAFMMSMTPDASRIASGIAGSGFNKYTNVYDGATGKLAYVVQGAFSAFSPDGKRLLTGHIPDRPSAAKLWDATDGRELFAGLYGGHTREITAVAVSPDGKVGLTGDADGFVRAWNMETSQEILDLPLK